MKNALYLLLLFNSCNLINRSEDIDSEYFDRIAKNDIHLNQPVLGEWLYEHKESGQSLEQYKKSNPFKPKDSTYAIYLQPIGEFSSIHKSALELTRAYIEIFFQQKTILLPNLSDKNIPDSALRDRGDYYQIFAPYILNKVLVSKTPKNGIALMAFTEKDLYPNNQWNFVFGLASYKDRIGVTSIYRLYEKRDIDSNFNQYLRRLCQISSHEIGHMMSLKHCISAKCLMNGSNSLYETDNSPNRLCSSCQKKLFWNLRYDNEKRLKELINFSKTNKLELDEELLKLDT